MKQYIRKADIILFIILVVTGLAASAALAMSHTGGGKVIIESGGDLYATYSLFEDRTITVPAGKGIGSVTENTYTSEKSDTHADDESDSSGNRDVHGYGSYNIVTILNGTVSVTEASCKNQVCVQHAPISRSGESIICLPNKLVVRIEAGDDNGGGYDSVTS